MTREDLINAMPIIKAFIDGKKLQYKDLNHEWEDLEVNDIDLDDFVKSAWRIKPESEYRPFKDAEECWQEMLKHQPFGVVKDKYFANYQTHRAFTCLITNGCDFGGYEDETFESCFKNLLFADGFPFGVKIDE